MWRRPCPTAGWRRGGDRRRGIIANPDRLPRYGAEGGGEPSMNAKRILRIDAGQLDGWLAACTARYSVVGAFDDYDEVWIGASAGRRVGQEWVRRGGPGGVPEEKK